MDKKEKRRIGLMGGTFDPIHIGHLLLAECAYEQFQLEKVLFLPSGNPPHKEKQNVGATDQERMEMVRLAIAGNPHFLLDDEEMGRKGFTYTSDTLKSLNARFPDIEFYFIIGADSLMTLDDWHEPEQICSRCTIAVAVRNQLSPDAVLKKMREMEERYQARMLLLQTPDLEVSSSNLRALRESGRSIRYYVPDAVLAYICEHGIYV